MNVTEIKYFKGENHDIEERAEVSFMSDGGMDRLNVNIRNLCGGLIRYKTERGFRIDLPPDVQMEILHTAQREREKILTEYPIKTYAGWSESGIGNFGEYCKPGDEVDEAMTDYFLNIVPPVCFYASLIQCGEPYSHEFDDKGKVRPTFTTFSRKSGVWRYCGECFAGQTENRVKALRGIDRAINTLQKQKGAATYDHQ